MKNLPPLLIKRLLLIIFLSFGILIFLVLNGYKSFSLEQLKSVYIQTSFYVNQHSIIASIIYSIIYIITVFFSIPIKPFLKILAGLLFGLWLGFIICMFSATTGAMLVFLIIKYNWGDTSAKSKYKIVSKFKFLVEHHPIMILFISRLLPIPFFVPNILAAILKVRNNIFFFTTLFGIVPVTFIYVWFGIHFKQMLVEENIVGFIDAKFISALSVLAILALVPLFFNKLKLDTKK